jgi:hypothetical protein
MVEEAIHLAEASSMASHLAEASLAEEPVVFAVSA